MRTAVLAVALLAAALGWYLMRSQPRRGVAPPRANAVDEHGPLARASRSSEPEGVATATREALTVEARADDTGELDTGVRVRVVRDDTREPLAGIRVRASRADGGVGRAWTVVESPRGSASAAPRTEGDGLAFLELEPGPSWELQLDSTDGTRASARVAIDPVLAPHEVRALEVALASSSELVFFGRVVDGETLAPVANAEVGTEQELAAGQAARTDAAGLFRVAVAAWRTTLFGARAERYATTFVTVEPGHESSASAAEVRLARTATLRVRLLDADGAPMSGCEVELGTEIYRVEAHGDFRDPSWTATTDASGCCTFESLPARTPLHAAWFRTKRTEWEAQERVALEPGETRSVEWRPAGRSSVAGRVVDETGRQVSGVVLWLEPASEETDRYFTAPKCKRTATTDADGRFAFGEVEAGLWRVGPAPVYDRTGAFALLGRALEVAAGVTSEVELKLHRGRPIAGSVLDVDGLPNASGTVEARAVEGGAFASAWIRRGGVFDTGRLAPGEYELVAVASDAVTSEPMRVHDGDASVVLQLRRAGSLRGRVVDRATRQTLAALLVVRGRNAAHTPWRMRSCGASGGFRFRELEPDVYDLGAYTDDGRAGVLKGVELREGGAREDVVLEVEPGAELRLRYDGPKAAASFLVLADGAPVAVDDIDRGTETTLVVPSGTLVVRMLLPRLVGDELSLQLSRGERRRIAYDGRWR